jgi:hypothetical protein
VKLKFRLRAVVFPPQQPQGLWSRYQAALTITFSGRPVLHEIQIQPPDADRTTHLRARRGLQIAQYRGEMSPASLQAVTPVAFHRPIIGELLYG